MRTTVLQDRWHHTLHFMSTSEVRGSSLAQLPVPVSQTLMRAFCLSCTKMVQVSETVV